MVLTVHEIETNFTGALERVKEGEKVVIEENGRPVAVLSAVETPSARWIPGLAEGKVWISEDFDTPLPEDLQRFFGP